RRGHLSPISKAAAVKLWDRRVFNLGRITSGGRSVFAQTWRVWSFPYRCDEVFSRASASPEEVNQRQRRDGAAYHFPQASGTKRTLLPRFTAAAEQVRERFRHEDSCHNHCKRD